MARSLPYTMPIGQLVAKSLEIYLRNLLPFLFLGVLIFAPWIALHLYYTQQMAEAPPRGPDDPLDTRLMLLSLAETVLNLLLNIVLTGAVTFGVVQQLRGQHAGIAQVISKGLSSFGRVFLTSLLMGVLVGVGLVFLVIPGLIVLVLLYVAVPAAVMEGRGPLHSFSRSKLLTKGSRWRIFGVWLLTLLVSVGSFLLAGFVTGALDPREDKLPPWLEITLTVLLGPFSATLTAVAYFMLRQGKENVDPKAIAAVFD